MMTMMTQRATRARTGPEGACVIMATCKGCRGPISATNYYGYCTKSESCRNKARHLGRERNKEPLNPRTCKGCGETIYKNNKSGYCRKNQLCLMENRRYYNALPQAQAARRGYRDANPEAQMWSSAKWRAEKKGIAFSITREDIRAVMTDACPVFGYEFKHGDDGSRAPLACSPSLDKTDNSKGYIPGNIQVLSQKANAMKGDATPEELLKFADWIYATYGAVKGGG